jgi:pimeloyl-ACP methyl ester carboxylesterase
LLVHGLGGSHANFVALGPLLAERARVLAVDLPGFGLSPPGGAVHMAGFVAAVIRVLGAIRAGEIEGAALPVVLVGNSMGGAIAVLTAEKQPAEVDRVVLVCPALPQKSPLDLDPRFSLLLGAAMLPGYDTFVRMQLDRAGPEALVHQMLNLCCADKSRVPAFAVRAMVEVAKKRATFPWMGSAFSQAARSIVLTLARCGTYAQAMRAVRAPVLLVHGDRDRLVPVGSARAALAICPHWRLEIFAGVGHVPQLEAPARLAESITSFMSASGAALVERSPRR